MRYTCSSCNIHACNKQQWERALENCPSLNQRGKEIENLYLEEENYKIAQVSANVVMEDYGSKTRIMETIEFAIFQIFKIFRYCVGSKGPRIRT